MNDTPDTVPAIFEHAARRWPRQVAVQDDRGKLTFGQVAKVASALANRLEQVRTDDPPPGQNVGIMMPTIKEFPAAYYAVHLCGLTPVPINFLLDPAELQVIVEDAGLTTIIGVRYFEEQLTGLVPRVLYLEDLSVPRVLLTRTRRPSTGIDPDEVATLLYTSGTTGRPKGVELTHRNLVSNVEACMRAARVTQQDVVLGVLPFFHSFALTVTMNLTFACGVRTWYQPRFVARRLLDLIQNEGITLMPLIPSMYRMLNRSAERLAPVQHRLRVVISGGEPLPRDVAVDFERCFELPLLEGYGLTETSPVLSINRPGQNRPGTVGTPLDNLEVMILGEDGGPAPPDTDGEILVRGPSIMAGYRNQPEETAQVLDADGWFHTGDVGRLDAEGYLRITGRQKDLIISSGENIYPREIEDALTSHPAVFEAAVIGVPDRMRGEMPYGFVACVEGQTVTQEELREHLRGLIAEYKIPRTVEILPELPHAPTGKILKRTLRPAGLDPPLAAP
jgi:long-chain acyl-CoA synthetase